MGAFINGTGTISPQSSHNNEVLKNGFMTLAGNRFSCIEPDYSQFIDVKQIRRMSRIIKMGVVAAQMASRYAEIDNPDAIIVGTAFGCLEDTNSFLSKLVQYKEDMLSPTAFIHSTHNTIAAQVAIIFRCHGYNSTYVHKGISFESALMDAVLLLEEGTSKNVLVGGVDEITETGFNIMNRLGLYKDDEKINSDNLLHLKTKGTVAGEGATFFSVSDTRTNKSIAEIKYVRTFSFNTLDEVITETKKIFSENSIIKPDMLIAGFNGDEKDDKLTNEFINKIGCSDIATGYKHLCGEYGTASAFGLWMATTILKEKRVPVAFKLDGASGKIIENILLYNHHGDIHHSLILVTSC